MNVDAQIQIAKTVLVLKNAEHDQSSQGNRGGGDAFTPTKLTGGSSSMQSLVTNITSRGSEHARDEIQSAILSGAKQKYAVWDGSRIVAAAEFDVNDNGGQRDVELHHIGSTRPGAGSAMMKKVKMFALRNRLPIRVTIHEDAKGFYGKLGFKQLEGTLYEFQE